MSKASLADFSSRSRSAVRIALQTTIEGDYSYPARVGRVLYRVTGRLKMSEFVTKSPAVVCCFTTFVPY